ncbi:MAG: CoA transferase [Microbacterium sp.]
MDASFSDLLARPWEATGTTDPTVQQTLDAATVTGPRVVLPSAFDVTGLATSAVAAATLAAAQLHAARRSAPLAPVVLDSTEACAAFQAESLFSPLGWERPPLWDPIAGNYRAADGWIRLHTNYAHHRTAVHELLGAEDREGVQAAVAARPADELESAIVAAGGAAAAMHTRTEWLASPAGQATLDAPLLTIEERGTTAPMGWANTRAALPFSGIRVLDLTRVIAGPVCTKFLAAYGADVLRIDPPGFEEVTSLLPETTVGKRTAAVDLTTPEGCATFEDLVTAADVIVVGYRADALAKRGYDDAQLAALNPALITAGLDAYGWVGPWQNRRGFDSLVQMSCGIAADGAAAYGLDEPTPLPVQALDHATGWLLVTAIARALTRQLTTSVATHIKGSLIGTANLLHGMTPPENPLTAAEHSPLELEDTPTEWGPARRVPIPGNIEGICPNWTQPAGPLGRHAARWENREQKRQQVRSTL